jgi:hypothetical protein
LGLSLIGQTVKEKTTTKLNGQNIHIRSIDAADTLIRKRIVAQEPCVQIAKANLRVEHRQESSPTFRVHV